MSEVIERHASWLELFFDLVVVAAILQLAARLHGEPTLRDVGVFVALYLAVWIAWGQFTLYANVAGDKTRRRAMLLAMFGIAVMAAAIPQATGDRARAFTIAYVIVRVLGMRTWGTTRQVLTAWPTVQGGMGVVPWIASIWVDAPARYWLWGLGLVLDVGLPMFIPDQVEMPERFRRRVHGSRPIPEISLARLDLPHLAERLGLFLIIVLGEGVTQLVVAAGAAQWTRQIMAVFVAGFLILVGLWWPTFKYGLQSTYTGEMPVKIVMPFHFLAVVSITGTAAGLGALMTHPGHTSPAVRWLLAGGLGVYYLSVSLGAILLRRPWHWLWLWGIPSAAVPVLLAIFGANLPGVALAWVLVAVVAWQALYVWFMERRERGRNALVNAPVQAG